MFTEPHQERFRKRRNARGLGVKRKNYRETKTERKKERKERKKERKKKSSMTFSFGILITKGKSVKGTLSRNFNKICVR